ncbi:MAG: endonuclease/exonuclease/phosphatase family protein [Candidatus Hydrogenedentota bacterium]
MKRFLKFTAWIAGSIVAVFILLVTTCLLFNYRTPSPTDLSQSQLLASPPEPVKRTITLKIITFNIWDLYHESSHRSDRMKYIGSNLAALEPDIVGFQEAFIAKDRQVILGTLAKAGLSHAMYFPSGLVGSGLLVVSRYPIEEAFFHRYTEGGKPYKVHHGDWWAGKGVCVTRLALPEGYVDFFNTHIHAQYNSSEYDHVRMSQIKELAAFINAAALNTVPTLSVGDYNVEPSEPQYQTLVEEANLERMMTMDTRIDHIFAVNNSLYTFEVLKTVPIEAVIHVPGGSIGLSDHSGYMSTIRIRPAAKE